MLREHLAHRPAQPAQDGLVLHHHDKATGPGGLDDALLVDRFDGRDVQDGGLDAPPAQDLGRLVDPGRLDAGAHQGDVGAFSHPHRSADLKAVTGVEKDRRRLACHLDVNGTVERDHCRDGLACLHLVRRRQHGHVGQSAHYGNVIENLVGLAGHARQQAGVAPHDLDVEGRLCDQHADRVERPGHDEAGERRDDGDEAHGGQAGGHAEHVLFGYPHLEEPLRVGGLEDLGPRGTAHVAVQDEDPGVVIGQFGHGLTEDGTKGLAGGQRHVSSPRFGRPRFGRLGRKAQPMPLPAPGWSGPGCAIGSHLP